MKTEELKVKSTKLALSDMLKESKDTIHFSLFTINSCEASFDGDVAQLARAPALQAGGQEFDSPYLHHRR